MTTREDVLAEARSWIGVPYLHQGRNRNGVDCVGLVVVVAHALGLTRHDVRGYGRVPCGEFVRRELDEHMAGPGEAWRPGDVGLFRFGREPQHVAFFTERGILHAWAVPGAVVETGAHPTWRRRLVAAYRLPGVV